MNGLIGEMVKAIMTVIGLKNISAIFQMDINQINKKENIMMIMYNFLEKILIGNVIYKYYIYHDHFNYYYYKLQKFIYNSYLY